MRRRRILAVAKPDLESSKIPILLARFRVKGLGFRVGLRFRGPKPQFQTAPLMHSLRAFKVSGVDAALQPCLAVVRLS